MKKSKTIQVRVTVTMWRAWQRAAAIDDYPLGGWIRRRCEGFLDAHAPMRGGRREAQ